MSQLGEEYRADDDEGRVDFEDEDFNSRQLESTTHSLQDSESQTRLAVEKALGNRRAVRPISLDTAMPMNVPRSEILVHCAPTAEEARREGYVTEEYYDGHTIRADDYFDLRKMIRRLEDRHARGALSVEGTIQMNSIKEKASAVGASRAVRRKAAAMVTKALRRFIASERLRVQVQSIQCAVRMWLSRREISRVKTERMLNRRRKKLGVTTKQGGGLSKQEKNLQSFLEQQAQAKHMKDKANRAKQTKRRPTSISVARSPSPSKPSQTSSSVTSSKTTSTPAGANSVVNKSPKVSKSRSASKALPHRAKSPMTAVSEQHTPHSSAPVSSLSPPAMSHSTLHQGSNQNSNGSSNSVENVGDAVSPVKHGDSRASATPIHDKKQARQQQGQKAPSKRARFNNDAGAPSPTSASAPKAMQRISTTRSPEKPKSQPRGSTKKAGFSPSSSMDQKDAISTVAQPKRKQNSTAEVDEVAVNTALGGLVQMQGLVRGFLVRLRMKRHREAGRLISGEQRKDSSSRVIQRVFRGHIGRNTLYSRRKDLERRANFLLFVREEARSVADVAAMLGTRARRAALSAFVIQQAYRCHVARAQLMRMRMLEFEAQINRAAIVIQRAYRDVLDARWREWQQRGQLMALFNPGSNARVLSQVKAPVRPKLVGRSGHVEKLLSRWKWSDTVPESAVNGVDGDRRGEIFATSANGPNQASAGTTERKPYNASAPDSSLPKISSSVRSSVVNNFSPTAAKQKAPSYIASVLSGSTTGISRKGGRHRPPSIIEVTRRTDLMYREGRATISSLPELPLLGGKQKTLSTSISADDIAFVDIMSSTAKPQLL